MRKFEVLQGFNSDEDESGPEIVEVLADRYDIDAQTEILHFYTGPTRTASFRAWVNIIDQSEHEDQNEDS